jgi:hypothetical protein
MISTIIILSIAIGKHFFPRYDVLMSRLRSIQDATLYNRFQGLSILLHFLKKHNAYAVCRDKACLVLTLRKPA